MGEPSKVSPEARTPPSPESAAASRTRQRIREEVPAAGAEDAIPVGTRPRRVRCLQALRTIFSPETASDLPNGAAAQSTSLRVSRSKERPISQIGLPESA